MRSYVLVPGAWCGGFCWRPVVKRLRAAGHEAYPVTLTGVGERAHLARPDTDLNQHIQDVVNVLTYEELTDVVLVGHSYAGMVITGVADRAPEQLGHLVYLDARVPRDGESQLDNIDPGWVRRRERRADALTDALVPPPAVPPALAGRWPFTLFTHHPARTLTQPLRLAQQEALDRLPKTYIRCTRYEDTAWKRAYIAERTAGPGWRHHELTTGHMAMVTMPEELTRLLVDCRA
jgi:pimeloyl-ACP methyl ester carboxylesterase